MRESKNTPTVSNFTAIVETTYANFDTQLNDGKWLLSASSQSKPEQAIALQNQAGEAIAVVLVSFAKHSFLVQRIGFPEDAFHKILAIDAVWLKNGVNHAKILPIVLYFALRFGRVHGMGNVVAVLPKASSAEKIPSLLHLQALANVEFDLDGNESVLLSGRIKYSQVKLLEQFSSEDKAVMPKYYVKEIIATHRLWLEHFYQGSWARAIIEERISKEQYIWSLYNLHQYVKWTTRLCARCIAHADDIVLRNNYIHHLKGEINHELLIEKDLAWLGVDINYILTQHVPSCETNEFISIQESTIGFKQDSALMLACPLVAEGVTAFMDKNFINHLHNAIASWGVQEPEKASKFLSSHMHFDGGEDGHWLAVVSMLERYITDEVKLQQFLCTMRTAMNGFERGFNAVIDEMKLWEYAHSKEQVCEQVSP